MKPLCLGAILKSVFMLFPAKNDQIKHFFKTKMNCNG